MPRIALCGALTIGVDSSEPNTPPLVMREGAAGQVLERDRAIAGTRCEVGDRLLDVREAHRIRVAQHRHDQAALGRDRDPDVEILVIDDVVALDRGVHDREALERLDRGLDEERHEAELHAVFLLEARPCSGRAVPARRLRSTSLKVVSSAWVACACTSRSAMRARSRVIGTRCSARPSRARASRDAAPAPRRRRARGRRGCTGRPRPRAAAERFGLDDASAAPRRRPPPGCEPLFLDHPPCRRTGSWLPVRRRAAGGRRRAAGAVVRPPRTCPPRPPRSAPAARRS